MGDPGGSIRFAALGPLLVRHGDDELSPGTAQQRVVLAVLLLHPNQRVSRERLIDAVWGEAAPAYAINLLQKRISGLRRMLQAGSPGAENALTWTDAGYRLAVPAGCLDLSSLDALIAEARSARAAGDLPGVARAVHAALGLWRGPAFEGLSSPMLDAERVRLAELRVDLIEERIDVDLTTGAVRDPILELRRLVGAYPLRERLRGLLMLALYRSGRQAEALEAFREARRHLADELGVDPGVRLRRLHEQILSGDPSLGAAAEPEAATRPELAAVPAELPRRSPYFVGREADLEHLASLLADGRLAEDGTAVVAITGTAGVGKTALAVHWGHRVRHLFPDGQLYVNLHGFAPAVPVTDPADAVQGFLDRLGVPAHRLPSSTASQFALYRSLLADRRALILLDNARDGDQVRQLIPGGPGCLVIVTSRNELPGLVMAGAVPVALDLLAPDEARGLMDRRLGADRTRAEPQAVDDIVESCARLPLALTIAAAHAASRRTFPLARVAAELREVRGRLDAFDAGDPMTDIRAVFSWSYQALPAPAARLFRLLGLIPGPEISAAAAASLAGLPPAEARRPLNELARAHLVTERMPGRFAFHDLLRAYAAELAEAQHAPAEREIAVRRLLDHYLHTAARAQLLLNPHVDVALELPAIQPGVHPERIVGHEAALDWFAGERPALMAAMAAAVEAGIEPHRWQLICELSPFLEYQGQWREWREALETSRRHGGPGYEALVQRLLGRVCIRLGRHDESARYLNAALEQYTKLGDLAGQAHTHREMCWRLDNLDRPGEALDHAERALELFRSAGHRSGEARALNAVGWFHIKLGDHEQALRYCRAALDLQLSTDDRFGQAETWDSLGYLYRHAGQAHRATDCYQRALQLYREFDDRYNEADTLASLGDAAMAAGDTEAAGEAWRHALTIFRRLRHPDVARVRAKLDALSDVTSPPALAGLPDP
ncbi:AfsR/SARP family transcriptional regulator [Actinoplanes awajinensis]|uniref:OmpR/PhoB-type domain-containing protein n=1 Tax=Actinoplanes awajinensis subsp. mycoplanecinus TaxID=135947 RepID=A0A101JKM4_9ACTN|nr:BTAD domain-containing putative transcriptional regulator [Actinoplanes awajinensis]KUL28474.1 hypothetical protein ADL15_32175 [Actinoplanes awajinensis subsp. mycoplanecinus]